MTQRTPYLRGIALAVVLTAGIVACSGRTASPIPMSMSVSESQSRRVASAVTANSTLCLGGTEYGIAQDDEFANDTSLASNPRAAEYITQPAPPSIIWSTQLQNIGRFNNPGIDDSYDVDITAGLFGGYNPFSFSGGALKITAEPVPAQYAATAVLAYPSANPQPAPHHWLSGILQGPPLQYGYVEVQAEEPTGSGAWPAPLWLIDSNGNTLPAPHIQELDVNEVFGTVLPYGQVQQTEIFHYAPNPLPQSNDVRTTVSSDPSKNYHTYGVLWDQTSVTYYIDRVVTARYPATSSGPMNPIIALQIYVKGIYGQNPGTSPISMSLKYYRWYQATASGCSPSVVPTATPAPTAPPTPGAVSSAVAMVQTGAETVSHSFGNVPATLPAMPTSGHMLVGIGAVNNPLTMPSGWTALQNNTGNLAIMYCIVGTGSGQCPAATTYNFGGNTGNGGVLQLFELKGATGPPIVGKASAQYSSPFSSALTIPTSGGLTLLVDGLYSSSSGVGTVTDTLPAYFGDSVLSWTANNAAGGNDLSLRVAKIDQETYQALQPFSVSQSAAYTGSGTIIYGANLLWVPGGSFVATPSPTPAPTATPTTAPTAKPTASPTPAPTATPTATPTSKPTTTPTVNPTSTPSPKPTSAPSTLPTSVPTPKPTATPSAKPTTSPTAKPTATPAPTATPTHAPYVAGTYAGTVQERTPNAGTVKRGTIRFVVHQSGSYVSGTISIVSDSGTKAYYTFTGTAAKTADGAILHLSIANPEGRTVGVWAKIVGSTLFGKGWADPDPVIPQPYEQMLFRTQKT